MRLPPALLAASRGAQQAPPHPRRRGRCVVAAARATQLRVTHVLLKAEDDGLLTELEKRVAGALPAARRRLRRRAHLTTLRLITSLPLLLSYPSSLPPHPLRGRAAGRSGDGLLYLPLEKEVWRHWVDRPRAHRPRV